MDAAFRVFCSLWFRVPAQSPYRSIIRETIHGKGLYVTAVANHGAYSFG